LATYEFRIANLAGTVLDTIPARNPTWSYTLNEAGAASLFIPLNDAKAVRSLIDVGLRELHVMRDGVRVWAGYLWLAQAQASDNTLRLGFEGFFSMLFRRHVDATLKYVNVDQFDIAWNLIAHAQGKTNGYMGFTRFSAAASGKTRDRTYPFWERTNIGEELIALSEVGQGFDFEITPTKEWKTYYPSKGATLTADYELGNNVATMYLEEDAGELINSYSAIGAGDGKNTCIAVALDSTSAAAYGLREASGSFTNVKHFSTLQDRANSQLALQKDLRVQPQLSVMFDDFAPFTHVVGDRVDVIGDFGWIEINRSMRITTMTYALTNDGREACTVQFDEGPF